MLWITGAVVAWVGRIAWMPIPSPESYLFRPASEESAKASKPRFTVVPPGPVTNRISVELRLAIPNPTDTAEDVTIRLYWDRPEPASLIATRSVRAVPHSLTGVSVWCPTDGRSGKHRLVYGAERAAGTDAGEGPSEVVSAETPALPVL